MSHTKKSKVQSASIQKMQGSECIHKRYKVQSVSIVYLKKGKGTKGGDECIHTKDTRFRVHPYKRYKVQSVSIVYLKKGKGTKGGR